MKIAVACESPLLQKSLELFLKKHLCVEKRCDILVKDTPCYGDKRCFYISTDKEADLIKPFSKSQLLLQLEKLESRKNPIKSGIDISNFDDILQDDNVEKFDEKLDKLIDEFSEKLKNLIKEHYGKK